MNTRWTPIGLSDDLPDGVVMAARCHDIEVAVWRSASGVLSAWKDRCPHRGMRLSHGFVRGETLACIYHGWVYGTDGGCRHIPAHPALAPPAAIRAEAFMCVAADGVLWLAPAGSSEAPPPLNGLHPVRSLSLTCDLAAILAAEPGLTGQDILRGQVRIAGQMTEICLLVQSRQGGLTLHALCEPAANPVQVSRWLEALRRLAEQKVAA